MVGIGGLGHLVLQYARETDPVEAIQRLGGADVAIALAVSPEFFGQVYRSLARGGRVVCVALPANGTFELLIFDTVLGGKPVIGSIVGTRNDLTEVFGLHAAGRTRVIATGRKLPEINDCFAEILRGEVPARLVLEF